MTVITETQAATELDRIKEAYAMMVPNASEEEARYYAARFIQEEDSLQFHIGVSNWKTNRALVYFHIGVSNWKTNRALVYTIEAARALCRGEEDERALRLLEMAIDEVKTETEANDQMLSKMGWCEHGQTTA
jgi:hypothetical protein